MRVLKKSLLLLLIMANRGNAQLPASPEEILGTLSLQDKIAQLIIVAAVSNEQLNADFMAQSPYCVTIAHVEKLIRDYHVGGVLFLGSGYRDQQKELTQYFQQLCILPLLIAIDAEWGLTMRIKDAIRLPHNMTLGAIGDPQLIYLMGYEVGLHCAQLGIHINLAPVMDVNNNPNNPVINDRSFGSNPFAVCQKGTAYMKGLHDAGVISCIKHFPGHGDTDVDSHNAMPIILHDRNHLNAIELVPFKAAIENGAMAVMTAHIQIPSIEPDGKRPATLSQKITTDLLRNELGFKGLIITDGLGMKGITNQFECGRIAVEALKAGADILLAPVDVIQTIAAIEQAVKNGEISEAEIDAKVMRVLKAKEWALKNKSKREQTELDTLAKRLNQVLYTNAITLVKNTLDPHRDKSADMIIEITGMNKFKHLNFGISAHLLQTIKELKQEKTPTTVILYGSPYAVELVQDADRIVVAYEDDPDAHRAVAAFLAGINTAPGILPV